MDRIKVIIMHYKAPNNSVHFIEPQFAYLLPAGCIAITDAEAEALRPKPPAPTYQELRAAAYPPIGDQLDAMWKGGEAEAAMKQIILDVKAEYPK